MHDWLHKNSAVLKIMQETAVYTQRIYFEKKVYYHDMNGFNKLTSVLLCEYTFDW